VRASYSYVRLSAGRLDEAIASRWFAPAVLAIPFLIGIVALRGLTAALPIFHGSDETFYQLPTILQFGHQLPFPDLGRYPAAQTPLFHVLLAYVGKLIGYELWRLRLVEVVISYALALAVYGLLRRRLRLSRWPALLLALLFTLSPYVYGTSVRVLTDNLATLFVVLAIERLERYRQTNRLEPFAGACLSIAAAMLTRQSTAFMLGVAALYAFYGRVGARERVLALIMVGLSAVPVGLLFLTWHGLVPPGGDPSSCGLCSSGRSESGSGLEVQSPELALATIGLYGAVLFGLPLLARGWRRRTELGPLLSGIASDWRGALVAAAFGALLLAIWPATPGAHAAGLLWNAARRLPAIDGTSLLFWVLVPISGAVLWIRVRLAPQPWLPAVFVACFLLTALVIRYPWQKYVDPFALLTLMFTVRRDELRTARELSGAAVLAVGFVAYTLSFVI
jgi:4-amino-4-deoxy-L-arabinose transferase-like glycosyltransferase